MGCLLGALGAPRAPRVLNAAQRARRAARAGVRALGRCFAEGTPVETSDGPRSIEEVSIGDLVLAMDDETGEQSWRPVTETFKTRDQPLVSVDLAGSEPPVFATPEHPFWKDGAGWTGAGDLAPGDLVWTTTGWREVESVADAGVAESVYNLEVEDDHTYFVGDDGAWVHNACGNKGRFKSPRPGSGKQRSTDTPSWAKGKPPYRGESGVEYATRLMNERYGEGGWSQKGPGSEFNRIRKYGDRGWVD